MTTWEAMPEDEPEPLQEDYTAWNKVMEALEEMYQTYNGVAGKYRPHNEVLAELMTAYDEWLD